MKLNISKNAEQLGAAAAAKVSELLRDVIAKQGKARLLVSTGASQFEYFKVLAEDKTVDWSKVEVFHLDEYIGIPETHPASFRKYLRERFISKIHPAAFHEVDGTEANIAELTAIWKQSPADIGVIGIGENAHIAFNDPPADFDTKEVYKIVNLDEACRRQQLGEGWFPTFDDVPKQAVSMTVNAILQCGVIVSVVPHAVKAKAVKGALESPEITPDIPATALRRHSDWHLYIDENSASLLNK